MLFQEEAPAGLISYYRKIEGSQVQYCSSFLAAVVEQYFFRMLFSASILVLSRRFCDGACLQGKIARAVRASRFLRNFLIIFLVSCRFFDTISNLQLE